MKAHGLATEAQAIHDSQGRLGSRNSEIRRGRTIRLLQGKQLLDHFIATEWPIGRKQQGEVEIRRCLRTYGMFLAGRRQPIDTP